MKTQFEADKNVLTVKRTFNADLNAVWRAWTEAELLDQWWAPSPWQSKTKSMDFKESGQRLYAMVGPEGEEHWGLTTYKSIQAQVEFSGEDAFCDSEGNVNDAFPVAEFHNHFVAQSTGTSVTIITKYASEEHLKQVIEMGMKEGLNMAFDSLEIVLTSISTD
ncbi:ATPase [Roseivirga sp. 4D4]|uniref:SRPBCC family protein n=1 Tax=Roseivirga sp. 4D4 TaxID=1889784 RepID=UPI000852A544|nr:SRPBCC domain-containing protein [Roseivirga sp. 4D4]OEK01049.1 ATPase [Roseivirga sp. 4D4]